MSRIPVKSYGKKPRGFLQESETNSCENYTELIEKTFDLANWKQSELDVKMKRKTGSNL